MCHIQNCPVLNITVEKDGRLLSSEVSSFLHVSVCNFRNLLEVRIRNFLTGMLLGVCIRLSLGETALFHFFHILREGFFLYSWVVSVRTVGKRESHQEAQ